MKHPTEGVPGAPVIEPRQQTVKAALHAFSAEARFWSKVDRKANSDCWMWKASLNRGSLGYGQFFERRDGKVVQFYSHRAAWAFANGPIPNGLHVLHRCDNPRCCNPKHLYLGTPADNVADCIARKRTNRRLTKFEVLHMVELWRDGMVERDLTYAFEVSLRCVRSILRGLSWAKVTGIKKQPRNGSPVVFGGKSASGHIGAPA